MTIELKKRNSGFTLVEMAIVLVIIGIILAGVMKGRDIVRGAQVKQFSQQFAQKWGTVCQTYYDKTGQFFLDGIGNGSQGADVPDGQFDGDLAVEIIAETEAPNVAAPVGPVGALLGVGIQPCAMIKSKFNQTVAGPITAGVTPSCGTAGSGIGTNLVVTQVEGEFAGTSLVEVNLESLIITDGGGIVSTRNCVVLYNVPTDVAIGLDTAIDGNVDGEAGSVQNVGDDPAALIGTGTAVNALPWPSASAGSQHAVAIILDY